MRFFARLLVPIGLLVGIHIFWAGADEPGGAFQAGAILSAMWMITMIARLSPMPQINAAWLRACLIAGPAVFVVAGIAGFALAGGFLSFPPGYVKPLILFIEAFMMLLVAATLAMLVAGPPHRAPQR